MPERIYFHSPFSRKNVGKHPYPYLLLSFILSELFACTKLSSDLWFFPAQTHLASFSPASDSAPFNKLQEHSDLLEFAFPTKPIEATSFKNELFFFSHLLATSSYDSSFELLKKLFSLFIPFIEEGSQSETFLFFLLKHQKEVALLSDASYLPNFLEKIHPDGFFGIQNRLCDYFHKKGFSYLIQEVKTLFDQLLEGSVL